VRVLAEVVCDLRINIRLADCYLLA